MRTLLLVHAHPDDESILTGGVIALAHRDGHRVVLVTATQGEDGDRPDAAVLALGELRRHELEAACVILGVDRLELLGYRGSEFEPDGAAPEPDALRSASVSEVAARVVAVLRAERPDVVVTYGPDGTYGHPDHVMVHRATVAAVGMLADEGWVPSKLYLHAVPTGLVATVLQAAQAADIELPETVTRTHGTPEGEITTIVDVSTVLDQKLAAAVEHRSQMQVGLPLAAMAAGVFEMAFGVERFVLLRGERTADERPETSLFSGLH